MADLSFKEAMSGIFQLSEKIGQLKLMAADIKPCPVLPKAKT